jgi:hypothetical protein
VENIGASTVASASREQLVYIIDASKAVGAEALEILTVGIAKTCTGQLHALSSCVLSRIRGLSAARRCAAACLVAWARITGVVTSSARAGQRQTGNALRCRTPC